jgi:general secretion pathway protein F
MAAFSYQALDVDGKKVKGIIEGDSARQIRQILREKNLKPLDVNQTKQESADKSGSSQSSLFNFGGTKLKPAELALFTRQLATLVRSNLPLDEALQAVAQQSGKAQIKSLVLELRSKVLEGHSLAYALGEYPKVFSDMYQAMVKAGEHAGFLGVVLERLADYTENSQYTRQKIKAAMTYPMVLAVVAIAVVVGLMVKVVPNLVKVFASSGAELPALTKGLIWVSDYLLDYGIVTFIVIATVIFFIRRYFQKPGPKYRLHGWLLKMPLIANIYRSIETARFSSTLSMLVASGVPLLQAIQIAAAVLSNLILREVCTEVATAVQEGSSFHKALDQSGEFPPMLVHMVASGEASGELEAMLERVSINQEREVDMTLTALVSVIEPLMIVFMSLIVMTIVIAILLPIIDLNTLT